MKALYYCGNVLKNYVGFDGRARRAEFWWFTLVSEIVLLVLEAVDDAVSDHGIIGDLFAFAFFLPTLAVTCRRLHDTNRSGWWILFGFVPIVGWITVIVFLCQNSAPGPNNYGPNPKGVGGDPGPYNYGPYPYAGYGPYGTAPQSGDGPQDAIPYPYSN
jgi:uncharacterized membrane protein YhaH (DUF805 family)